MKQNEYLSGGALLFYALMALVLASLGVALNLLRKVRDAPSAQVSESQPRFRSFVLTVGACLAGAYSLWVVGSWIGGIGASRTPSAIPQQPPATIPPPSFDAHMTLPDGRDIITSSPEDLRAVFHAGTTEQFNRMLSGKWVQVSVKVQDVWSGGRIYDGQAFPSLILWFTKRWNPVLAEVPRGSIVTVRCQLIDSNPGSIKLDACELLSVTRAPQ